MRYTGKKHLRSGERVPLPHPDGERRNIMKKVLCAVLLAALDCQPSDLIEFVKENEASI